MQIRSDIEMPTQRPVADVKLDERTMAFHDRGEHAFWKLHAQFWNERGNWPNQKACLDMIKPQQDA